MTDRTDRPLSEREVEELDQLLAGLPQPYDTFDVVALDGFLLGILLQPEPVPEGEWMQLVWHPEGAVVPDNDVSQRIEGLVRRRHAELAACLAAGEEFDPILFDLDDDEGAPHTGRDAIAALGPWVIGFVSALQAFPGLEDLAEQDEDVAAGIVLITRHLPPLEDLTEAEREDYERHMRSLDADAPVADLDDALDVVIGSALRIDEIVHPRRPLVRETPKVGRNDPCPCGSGRKYKACHGGG